MFGKQINAGVELQSLYLVNVQDKARAILSHVLGGTLTLTHAREVELAQIGAMGKRLIKTTPIEGPDAGVPMFKLPVDGLTESMNLCCQGFEWVSGHTNCLYLPWLLSDVQISHC